MTRRFLPRIATTAAYARPARTAKTPTATETQTAENTVTIGQVDAWCDTYMARLAHSVIMTKSGRENKLRAATSGTDSAVLGALCKLMREKYCGCFEASEVDVARLAKVAENTAATALRRLENEAYIIRHPACNFGMPTRYSLVVEKLASLDADDVRNLGQVTDLESLIEGDLSDEAYRAKNLGKTARQVYQSLLVKQGQTMADLAKETGHHKSTIKLHIVRLADFGMVYGQEKKWYTQTTRVRTDDDLATITQACAVKRSERRVALEIERANEREEALARLREDLEEAEANPDLWDNDNGHQQAINAILVQIEELAGTEVQQAVRTAQKAERLKTYERQVEMRYRAYLACNNVGKGSLNADDCEAGYTANPIVYHFRALQKSNKV